jgi:peroxiredoxin
MTTALLAKPAASGRALTSQRPDLGRRHWLRHQLCCGAGLAAAGPLSLLHAAPVDAADSGADDSGPTLRGDPAIGSPVTWPTVTLLDGRPFKAAQAGGEATVVVFFATTCPFCARHNVHVQKLLDTTRGLPLRVLGVAHDRKVEHVHTYLARRQLSFPVSMDQAPLHAALSRKPGIPLTCVVDRQQRLREVIRGEMFEEDVLGLARWAQA